MPLLPFTCSRRLPGASLPLLLLVVLLALAAPGRASAAPVAPWITTSNGHFVDASTGQTVLLRGVDVTVSGGSFYQRAKTTLGANFVRLTPSWEEIEPNAPVGGVHVYDESYLSQLDAQVAWYQAHGVDVMIDMHQSDWSSYFAALDGSARGMPPWLYDTNPARYPVTQAGLAQAEADFFTDPQVKTWVEDLWTMLVDRYSSYPNVVGFEVISEPHAGAIDDAAATQALVDWQSDVAHVIAGRDPLATVFFMPRSGADLGLEGADFSSFSDLPHVALDFHDYSNGVGGITADGEKWLPSFDQTHTQSTTDYQGTIDQQEGFLSRAIAGAHAHGWPLLIGEWGVRTDDSGAAAYQDQMLQLFARYGLSWTRFSLSNGGQFALLNADDTLNDEGLVVQTALASTPSGLVNDGPPTVSGTLASGSTLTATTGVWTASPSTVGYQWYRCDSLGNSCVTIAGAAGSTYTLVNADADMRIRARVNVTASTGSSTALSPATDAVLSLPPASSVAPTVSGQATAGQALTGDRGTWTGKVSTYAYQWLSCDSLGASCQPIANATKLGYTAKTGDIGRRLAFRVTATGVGGSTTVSSAPTAAIAPAPIANTALPTVTGTALVGSQLADARGSWTGTISSYSTQWLRCDATGANCVAISGATNSHYTLQLADLAHTVRVQVTATGPGGSTTAKSAQTAVVRAVSIANTGLPATSGAAVAGTQLASAKGSWTGTITGYAYQWLTCNASGGSCTPISGATNSHYTLHDGDVGHTILFQVTATGPTGSVSASSAATAVVADLAPLNTAAPTLSGTTVLGKTLSLASGSWKGSNLALTYRWARCDASGSSCSTIGGATSRSYKLTSADVGFTIRGYVRATNTAGSVEAATTPSAVVTKS